MELTTSPKKFPSNFNDFLLNAYDERSKKNPSYSRRSFARDIGVSSGKLSDLLNHKARLSKASALKILEKLQVPENDREFLKELVAIDAKNSSSGSKLYNSDSSYVVLQDDYFNVLGQWHDFAIVELVGLADFKNNDEWISKKLDIDINLVRPAIEKLLRVNLLVADGDKLKQNYDFFVSPSGTPSEIAKKFHVSLLEKALKAIFEQDIESRNFTSGFLRVRMSDLPYVAKKIKEFRRELCRELEQGEGHDSVYALSVQLFRADH